MAIPRIAITPGEPAGIGPDILLQIAQEAWSAELVAIADTELLQQRAALLGLPITLAPWSPETEAQAHPAGTLQVHHVPLAGKCTPGSPDLVNAGYVLQTLRTATQHCVTGALDALVTGPVQKSVINEAGVPFSGHTEFLAEITGTPRVVMMLATEQLRVALATTHLPLAEVPGAISAPLLRETLAILLGELRHKFSIDSPCVAVLGLNPHAGEEGHLGREEIDIITPVLDKLRSDGHRVLGPLPADTAFNPDTLQQADAYFAMYHDQGLPVLKYAGFGEAVNITLGLPLIRTSVDHGTALELAGSGLATSTSLIAAIESARSQCATRRES